MRYSDFEIDDFVEDEKFRAWVLRPSPEICFFWEKWLLQNAHCEKKIQTARRLVESLGLKTCDIREERKKQLHDRIINSISTPLENKPSSTLSINKEGSKKNRYKPFLYLLAACILLGIISFAFWEHRMAKELMPQKNLLVVKENNAGRKSTIFLPDGTKVILNSTSRLSYDQSGFSNKRLVDLEGEAYFEVAENEKNPFTVRSGGISTTAIGTTFNIRSYESRETAEVVLTSGKVEVVDLTEKSAVTLIPGEMASLRKGDSLVVGKTPSSYDIQWKDGVIFYEKLLFPQVIDKLERWYGVEFVVPPLPNKDLRSSGQFDNENLSNVLKSIGYALKFDYEIKEDTVRIEFK